MKLLCYVGGVNIYQVGDCGDCCALIIFSSEFGAYLVYFFICDRTNLLGESKKVLF